MCEQWAAIVLSAGIHLPTGIPLSPVQETLTISTPKHRLGERWVVFHRGGETSRREP